MTAPFEIVAIDHIVLRAADPGGARAVLPRCVGLLTFENAARGEAGAAPGVGFIFMVACQLPGANRWLIY